MVVPRSLGLGEGLGSLFETGFGWEKLLAFCPQSAEFFLADLGLLVLRAKVPQAALVAGLDALDFLIEELHLFSGVRVEFLEG